MNKDNQGLSKDKSSFFIPVFENMSRANLKTFSEHLAFPKNTSPYFCETLSFELFWRWDVVAPVQRLTNVCDENGTQRVGQRKTWLKV